MDGKERNMSRLLSEIHDGVVQGERLAVQEKIQEALQSGLPPMEVLSCMTRAMADVGNLFEAGEYFVPEMLIAARAMQEGMAILRPRLIEADVPAAGVIVAGTVQGDLHEIGKNLVCMLLDCAGFRIIDLGMDVSPEAFVEAVKDHRPNIVAMSALLTTTMPNMDVTIEALRRAELRQSVKVIIGGAPVTEAYARHINADGYSKDASQAVKLARGLLSPP
jgi:5-methyltetrahydrofolate--homocysteine methyltransferase